MYLCKMKQRRNLLIGVFLGALIGWALGFLRLPYLEKNHSFWLGMVTGLALVSLALLMLFVWNKNVFLLRLMGRELSESRSGGVIRHYTILWVLVAAFIFLGGLVSSVLIFRQSQSFAVLTQNQNQKILQQSELIESNRKSSLVFLMNNLFDKVDEELKNNPAKTLSPETIARITALGHSFQPYRYLEGDSLSGRKYSPERGQLLLTLFLMNLDAQAFESIVLHTPFGGADLRETDLSGANLAKADLHSAYLAEATLKEANLQGADLQETNFWSADLSGADLMEADLKRANLAWADLRGSKLNAADLAGVDLSNAQLKKADLRGTILKWARVSGSILHGANMAGIDLLGSDLSQADLSEADLSEAYLSRTNFSEANLTGINLTRAVVSDEDWLEKLDQWRVIGAKEIKENYQLVGHESNASLYRLKKFEE
jgi:uncharacterized protein YjbI with pentapeptide repeats